MDVEKNDIYVTSIIFASMFHSLMHAIPYSGGFKGFDKTVWEVAEYNKGHNPSITFKYYSKDGEEGTVTINFSKQLLSKCLNMMNIIALKNRLPR